MFTSVWDHVALYQCESEGVGLQYICWHCKNSFRCFGLLKIHSDPRCYGLCEDEAQAMRQVQPLVCLKQW